MDKVTKEKRSEIMANIRSEETKPELLLKPFLEELEFEYQQKVLGIKVDFVNRKCRTVIQVHGCFWHCCPIHGTMPNSNSDYWKPKLERNAERDREHVQKLTENNWKVVVIWEHNAKPLLVNKIKTLLMFLLNLPTWSVVII